MMRRVTYKIQYYNDGKWYFHKNENRQQVEVHSVRAAKRECEMLAIHHGLNARAVMIETVVKKKVIKF